MPNMIHNALHQSGLMHGHRYRPFVYVNELTVMRNHWVAVNASAPSVPLEVSAKPLKAEHFQWMVNLKHSFAMQEEQLGISEKESEELRGMLVHTNPNPNLTLTLTLTRSVPRQAGRPGARHRRRGAHATQRALLAATRLGRHCAG